MLYFDGLVWVHPAESDGKKQYAWEGLDPQTGKPVSIKAALDSVT